MLAQKLMGSAGGASDKLYVDDVFSTYLYTGNGSTQTINNGIDLAGKGGLVWIKGRNTTSNHALTDTLMGVDKVHYTNMTNAAGAVPPFTALSTGYATPNLNWSDANESGISYVSWTFRKAPKFFDVVTYTGNGSNLRSVSHSLGIRPGFVVIKRTDTNGPWQVWARLSTGEMATGTTFLLNETSASNLTTTASTHTATTFETYLTSNEYNTNGGTYVAYLFAHDPSADGIIQCGSFTTDGSGNATVTTGWEPQHIMFKRTDSTSNWFIRDSIRGWPTDTSSQQLYANLSDAEASGGAIYPTATGLRVAGLNASSTWIYKVIRRPNKPPTTGTQVYNAIARTGTGAATTVTGVGFAPDLVKVGGRNLPSGNVWFDRLRGAKTYLSSQNTYQEITNSNSVLSYGMGGCTFGADTAGDVNLSGGYNYINHFFKRAPGFFDVVCTNDNGTNQTLNHSLGVAPELIVEKQRTSGTDWWVQLHAINALAKLNLIDVAFGNLSAFPVTATTFKTAGYGSGTSVAYLFATLPGISKVGSYTGNGTTQTINCGFTTGARFILIKRTDSADDWYIWDTARGIVSANDPHLSLNTTAAEVTTDDSVDPANSGFIVNQVAATNINVTGGTYIFLAIS